MSKPNTIQRFLSGTSALFFILSISLSLASAEVPGLTYVSQSTPWNSESSKIITVQCPGTTVPIGTGYQIGGSLQQGKVHVTVVRPTGTGFVEVQAEEGQAGFNGNWQLRAQAICAEELPGLMTVSGTSNGRDGAASATATCPYDRVVVGTGAAINGGDNRVMLRSIEPTSDSVTVTAQEDLLGTTNVWSLTAHAFCAFRLPGLNVIEEFGTWDTGHYDHFQESCPAGQGLLGVGGRIETLGSDGDWSLERLAPARYRNDYFGIFSAAQTAGTISGTPLWSVQGYLICADL